jgi:hypothetical protein
MFDDYGTAADARATIEKIHQEAYKDDMGTAKGVLSGAADHLKQRDMDSVYQGKDSGPEPSGTVKVINLAEHKLRKVIRDKPAKEKQIQDAFESLLIGADIAFSRETDSIEYSSKTYTPDFTLPKLDLAVEIKFCDRAGREKEMIAEINDDILAYMSKYGNQLFIIYDIGVIRDVERFTSSFEEHQSVIVRVVKH